MEKQHLFSLSHNEIGRQPEPSLFFNSFPMHHPFSLILFCCFGTQEEFCLCCLGVLIVPRLMVDISKVNTILIKNTINAKNIRSYEWEVSVSFQALRFHYFTVTKHRFCTKQVRRTYCEKRLYKRKGYVKLIVGSVIGSGNRFCYYLCLNFKFVLFTKLGI